MRKIEYRAIDRSDGGWVYGIPYKTDLGNWMMRDDGGAIYPIDPETIGQITDFKDVADRNIYEGDMLAYGQKEPSELFPFKGPYCSTLLNTPVICRWSAEYSAFRLVKEDGTDWGLWMSSEHIHEHYKIIGNIHDHEIM